jgi:DNA-binding NtrC family response regulator
MAETMKTSIFVVDDEPVIAQTLAVILQNANFQARAFSDPQEALDAATASTPALLLSDVVMPGMTGIKLAIAMRKKCRGCKVLLFSGQAKTAELLTEAAKEGHDFELLLKPVHPKDLLAKLAGLSLSENT